MEKETEALNILGKSASSFFSDIKIPNEIKGQVITFMLNPEAEAPSDPVLLNIAKEFRDFTERMKDKYSSKKEYNRKKKEEERGRKSNDVKQCQTLSNDVKQCQTLSNDVKQCQTLSNDVNTKDKDKGKDKGKDKDEDKSNNNLDDVRITTGGNPDHTKKTVKRFVKPTREEVAEYFKSKGSSLDPDAFYDHYESNGWKVGKNPMKEWRMAINNWIRTDKNFKNPIQVKQQEEADIQAKRMRDAKARERWENEQMNKPYTEQDYRDAIASL